MAFFTSTLPSRVFFLTKQYVSVLKVMITATLIIPSTSIAGATDFRNTEPGSKPIVIEQAKLR